MKYRIYIDLDFPDDAPTTTRPGFLATVEGSESDAMRLRQFLHGTKAQAADGSLTEMTWRVTAERVAKEAEWEDVEFDEKGHVR